MDGVHTPVTCKAIPAASNRMDQQDPADLEKVFKKHSTLALRGVLVMWLTVALANQRLPRRIQMDLSTRDGTITVARQST